VKKIFIDPSNIDSSLIKEAVSDLSQGKIVALPTETVYGLAARADKADSVDRLYVLKKRPKDKPFSLALGSVEEVFKGYFTVFAPFVYRLIEKFWPGPLTIIYYTKDDEKVGIRVPTHVVTAQILQALGGPVCLPSANISGQPEAVTAEEVETAFKGGGVDLIVDSGPCTFSNPSTVLDLTEKPFKVLREGVVSEADIARIFIKKRILFVCTGNSCRSPMAQYLLIKALSESKLYFKDRYEIISRGTSAFEGAKVSKEVVDILEAKEDIKVGDFSAKSLDRRSVLSSDLIFAMEDRQADYILRSVPTALGRVFSLKKFLPFESEQDIPDPIGKSKAAYEKVYSLIKEAVSELKDWV